MDTNDKGEYALLKVKQIALERGICLSAPTMANCRYDLVVDCGERLVRAQVKYADGIVARSTGNVQLDLRKVTRGNKRGKTCDTAQEVDALLVYVPKIDRVLWLEEPYFHGKQNIVIRIAPSKNNQKKNCLLAEDFFW
ncbi:MAG: hypothetical protein JO250_00125 [Armatimonadetes bacterium]|nr:hypothetical protein [Armatimonadota bacterium]